jgi:hypothetical protein
VNYSIGKFDIAKRGLRNASLLLSLADDLLALFAQANHFLFLLNLLLKTSQVMRHLKVPRAVNETLILKFPLYVRKLALVSRHLALALALECAIFNVLNVERVFLRNDCPLLGRSSQLLLLHLLLLLIVSQSLPLSLEM